MTLPKDFPQYSPPSTDEGPAAILVRLEALHEDVREIKELAKHTNGRVNKHDSAIAVLRWAVYTGGGAILAGLIYLVKLHMVTQ